MNTTKPEPDIEALFKAGKPITDAIRRGAFEAMKKHIRAGVPMVSYEDGEIVMLTPERLEVMLAAYEAETADQNDAPVQIEEVP